MNLRRWLPERVRVWIVDRRIRRVLDQAGWPQDLRHIFSGDVTVVACTFSEFYVAHYKDPNS